MAGKGERRRRCFLGSALAALQGKSAEELIDAGGLAKKTASTIAWN